MASVHTASCTRTVARGTDHVGSKARGGGGCSPASTARRDSWPRQGCRHCHRGAPRTASRAPPPASRRAAASRPHHRLVRTVRTIPLAQPRARRRPIRPRVGRQQRPSDPGFNGWAPPYSGCAACRAARATPTLWPPGSSTRRRDAADSHGGRRAGTRQAKAKLSPSRPITAARPAGRPHVLLAFPAPTAVSSPPPTNPSVAPPNLQSSRDIFFFFFCSAERSRPSTGVRTVHGWYPLHACNYKLWLTPGHLGICAC